MRYEMFINKDSRKTHLKLPYEDKTMCGFKLSKGKLTQCIGEQHGKRFPRESCSCERCAKLAKLHEWGNI